MRRLLALTCALLAAAPASAQGRIEGALEQGDPTLATGEYIDTYTVPLERGQWVEVVMQSDAIDPYVILRPPGCTAGLTAPCEGQFFNDDFPPLPHGGSFIWVPVEQEGDWEVMATSFAPREVGAYTLDVIVHDDGGEPQTDGVLLDALRTMRGALEEGHTTLSSGEFVHRYAFAGRAGDRVVVDLLSDAFDPYVILEMPNGLQVDNDDWEGARDRARIEHTLPVSGVYTALVTTYAVGETGGYTLTIEPRGRDEAALNAPPNRSDVIGGPAAAGDRPLRTGRDRALLFATDEYADAEIRDLVNPIADAEAIGEELRTRYGFEVEVVHNPTRAEVYAALGRYAQGAANEDDQLLVFFAGHGTFLGEDKNGRGFLIPSDGRAGDRSSWISYSDLADELDLLPAPRVLLVLDVCFGGSFVEQYRDVGDPYQTASPADIVSRYGRYRSRLALTSGAREYVSDGRPGQHSPFAFHFLRALRSPGGYNADGLLVFEEVVLYAREVDGPTPLSGGFGGNEPGSTFFFGARDLR